MTAPVGARRVNRHPCTEAEEFANWSNVQVYIDNYETRITVMEAGFADSFKVRVNASDTAEDFLEGKFENTGASVYTGSNEALVYFHTMSGDGSLQAYADTTGLGGGTGDVVTGSTYITVSADPTRVIAWDDTTISGYSPTGKWLLGNIEDALTYDTVPNWLNTLADHAPASDQLVGHLASGTTGWVSAASVGVGVTVSSGFGIFVDGAASDRDINLYDTDQFDTKHQVYIKKDTAFSWINHKALYITAGVTLAAGGITALTGAATGTKAYPILASAAPVANEPFAVMLDAAGGGGNPAVGEARAVGVVTANVNVTDITHTHAKAIAADYTSLASATSGYAKILGPSPLVGGDNTCSLLLGTGLDADAAVYVVSLSGGGISGGSAATMATGSGHVYSIASDGTTSSEDASATIYSPYVFPVGGDCPCARLSEGKYVLLGPDPVASLALVTGYDADKALTGASTAAGMAWKGGACP